MTEIIPVAEILRVPVHPYTMAGAVRRIIGDVIAGLRIFVVTANAEIIMMGQKDEDYLQILKSADLVLPDGAGTVWAGRSLGYEVPERVAGYDLFINLLQEAVAQNLRIFFFGAAPGVAEAAKAKCEQIYPGVRIVGVRNGYFKNDETSDIIDEINSSGAEMLFAALGAPKQEVWLARNGAALSPRLLMGIGGSFDVLAGRVSRAPKWVQNASLEWLYRLYKQPSRFRRMLVLPKFAIKVLRNKSNNIG